MIVHSDSKGNMKMKKQDCTITDLDIIYLK